MFRKIDIAKWKRRRVYEFFTSYEDPFFNMTAQVDVTALFSYCKETDLSFSLSTLFCSQKAANGIDEFRTRLLEDDVVIFDRIEATQTILLEDETFAFCYFAECDDLAEFNRKGREAVNKYSKLNTFDVESDRIDLIYYSVIPWISFTSFKHASRFERTQTVPRIVFGKVYDDSGHLLMPVSVEVNHMMMDGLHVGRYMESFQKTIDTVV